MTFAELLIHYRSLRGLSVVELSAASRVSGRTIRRLESGQDGLKASVAVNLCRALRVEPESLVAVFRPDIRGRS